MASRNTLTKRRWTIDLANRKSDKVGDAFPSPPGYMSSFTQAHAEGTRNADPNLVIKKSWDIALSPLKSVS